MKPEKSEELPEGSTAVANFSNNHNPALQPKTPRGVVNGEITAGDQYYQDNLEIEKLKSLINQEEQLK